MDDITKYAGTKGQQIITPTALYTCTKSGEAGVAEWSVVSLKSVIDQLVVSGDLTKEQADLLYASISNFNNEVTRAKNAEKALQDAIDQIETEISPLDLTELPTVTSSSDDNLMLVQDGETKNAISVSNFLSGVMAAIANTQGNINAEATARANADALLAPMSGPYFNGAIGSPTVTISSSAGTARDLIFGTSDTDKFGGKRVWSFQARGAVTSGNAGVSFNLSAFDDSGALLGIAFNVIRATQVVYFIQIPHFPTASPGDNTLQGATTAFVRAEIATGYTVATLPTDARRYTGARAYVTDASSPTFLGTLTGGGSVKCPVFYNGTAWVAG